MENIFLISGFISFIFLLFKFIEMRFIEKENKPLKNLIRDALVVYISVILGYYIIKQIQPIVMSNENVITPVFTDNPGF